MNREIKFRVWDKDSKKWKYIDTFFDEEIYMSSKYFDIKTLSQYTALKDKNGKEIYEGDVLEQLFVEGRANFKKGDKIIVQFFNESDCYFCGFGLSNITPLTFNKCKRMKVIGNIYENENLTN